MKQTLFGKLCLLAFGLFLVNCAMTESFVKADTKSPVVTMYRMYNPNNGEHHYTANLTEQNELVKAGWRAEGVSWIAPSYGDPVYRLYNRATGLHHYTMNEQEKNDLVKIGWRYEGIGWQSAKNKEIPLHRVYNPDPKKGGTHHYTINSNEKNNLVRAGWNNEGIAWYGVSSAQEQVNQTPQDTTTPPSTMNVQEARSEVARQTFVLINNYRRSKGLTGLRTEATIRKGANVRAEEIVTNFSHTRPNGGRGLSTPLDYGYQGIPYVENLGFSNFNESLDWYVNNGAQRIFNGWVNSPEHNKNLLNQQTTEGAVGVHLREISPGKYDMTFSYLAGLQRSEYKK
ncbi:MULTISPECIES: CAP domain-containing protein [Enterococcus]|uniref:Uncharacterized protein n=1 Tax=Enterococcus sulfureus ATCC 49903 TaxID=1140003 RepID=S0LD95_9ENTE|nr:CAP domain-containing protein [Enterococcus sulfureus]EOT49541.1 hypothetical protein OMY_00469 [Enterococcus sulfureus ATCC 49903]EOT87408.1 hypothetical protein I573_00464 [Enterococcus sulfureus ATCC 49903]